MKGIIAVTVRLIQAGKRIYGKKVSFFVLFAIAFLGSVTVLAELDLLPEAPTAPTTAITAKPSETVSTMTLVPDVIELPMKIEITKINLSTVVLNPVTTDITTLDKELLSGAVRYPTSAKLGEAGNVVLFGHSSYLPVVKNPAYKSFNGIQKLVAGDVVTVYSSATAYTYRVRSITKESANDATIPLVVSGKVLTLATCDSFGAKTDRFVVVADFVESHSISS